MDSLKCKIVATYLTNYGRQVVIAIDIKTRGDFTMFKVFKKFTATGFFQRTQQVSLRTVEAERIILQLRMFLQHSVNYLTGEKSFPVIKQRFEKIIAADVELDNAQWNLDVAESAKRLVRVSLVTYDVKQPIVSTYFNIQLYKKSEEEGVFRRDSGVTLTLQEVEEISDNRKQIIKSMKT